MAQVINSNITSLTAQRNLNTSRDALNTSLERLSSGLRINSAKDDAAGLAISERMSSQIRGLNQASRNANDGISLAQTAEGALNEVTNNLQRIRELAVQSSNSTNNSADRAALDQEVQQRLAEIDRISSQTDFNGKKLLDGNFGTAAFQIGANVGETINLTVSTGTRTNQIGQIAEGTSSVEVTTAALSGTGTIKIGTNDAVDIGASVAGTAVGQTAGSAYAKAQAINAANVPGLNVSATNNIEFGIAAATGGGTYSLNINGEDIFASYDLAANGDLSTQQISDAINGQSANTGVTATLSGGNLRLSAADGRDITIGQDSATGGISAGGGGSSTINGVEFRDGTIDSVANAALATDPAVNGGTLTFLSNENIAVTVDGAEMGFANAAFTLTRDTSTLSSIDVKDAVAANDALKRIDSALQSASSLRSTFGAVQNRFESTISNLQTTTENLSSARSRIQDADFAAETANMTRGQILQQAGVAILSQANSLPNNVLSLLR
ncbi:flagellin [Nitrosomonas cryotolerans]|uniref:Flagellin n=1 Tax=Nitrosomonas cryotolerans ATCC 49181 TaxID=1131553 RepID=A0A1N6I6F0_9PROT|nr:flagellin [Nitrosomonas cryotolerans]SFP91248.1 flagellin [Nitrosomonas cryotolerans]SIO27590.1 flagellin [Nitrosomonas cryotolerans ATCC 49181]